MSEITDMPTNLPSTNALDDLDDDLLQVPASYLSFGSTPYALPDPPSQGDKRTYLVRVECIGEHGPLQRNDGALRYKRDLKILWTVLEGEPQPPDPDGEQPGLFDEGDETGAE